jgi:RNA polymerase sigma-54 factor
MKQSLNLRISQQLTMTPQLQQAIRLLQLSTLDLQTEIQQTLDSNMMLEIADDEVDTPDSKEEFVPEFEQSTEDHDNATLPEMNLSDRNEIPEELPNDANWEDVFDSISHLSSGSQHNSEDDRDFTERNSISETLYDYLKWQLDLTPFSDVDRAIAMMIIESIDDNGYLQTDPKEIFESLKHLEITFEEVMAVLHRVQFFDPPGVGAKDLQECLIIQLKQLPTITKWREEALKLAEKYLDLLGSKDFNQLTRKMKLEREDLQAVINLIQTLNPRPGEYIAPSRPDYVVPDVFVRKIHNKWIAELNPDVAPRLRVNSYYADCISKVQSKRDAERLRSHLQEARWFIKSLKSRHETLLKVTRCIVDHQSAFLDYGEEAMKPLVLRDIAEELEMHESTISRVTTQKYIHTPRGIFELKYFFSSHVNTESGGECSSIAIRALIKKLISAENTTKPLSDNKIAQLLSEQGIKVARRTVAKYREAMQIPPSNERKEM